MRSTMRAVVSLAVVLAGSSAWTAAPIKNPTGRYLVWNDYKIEINQYGGLGRDWPADLVWQQYALLKAKADAEGAERGRAPSEIKAVLLVCPTTEATAYRKQDDGSQVQVDTKTTSMTPEEVASALEQWRQFEEMVYVYSEGRAALRTDEKVIDEPLRVKTDENWGFWSGPKRALLDKNMPFERGDYDSYNSIYNSKELAAKPWGGTLGADRGPKGCTSSDVAWMGRGAGVDALHGFMCWHGWLNQMCWAASNVMPYPEDLWSTSAFEETGYRKDPVNAWPWMTHHRDIMRFVIRPRMWARWTVTDPYVSPPIDTWEMLGPDEPGKGRDVSASKTHGPIVTMALGAYDRFDLGKAEPADKAGTGVKPEVAPGTYYFRTYVSSKQRQEVRIWAGADERFELWLNGVMVREGTGALRSTDDGQLIEKVAYATLEPGSNTLVLVLPNLDEHWKTVAFRVRVCKPDGSGELPDEVVYPLPDAPRRVVRLAKPVEHSFVKPKLYTWADVGDDPWLKLPRLDEAALRQISGLATLRIETKGVPYKVPRAVPRRGRQLYREVTPTQHIFLDVPNDAVASPWVGHPTENTEAFNNDLDFNWESIAWVRNLRRRSPGRDVVLVRFDVAEPVLHLLKTDGRPANECLVGYIVADHKIAYVALVDLVGIPTRELEALRR
jgi:hypothetical protein